MTLPPFARRFTDAKTDADHRVALFLKLFNLYPVHRQQVQPITILSYVDETRDVPLFALDGGLRQLTRQESRVFRPTVGEILGAAAREVIRVARRAEGREVTRHSREPFDVIKLEFWLQRGRLMVGQPEPEGEQLYYLTPELSEMVERLDAAARPAIAERADG